MRPIKTEEHNQLSLKKNYLTPMRFGGQVVSIVLSVSFCTS